MNENPENPQHNQDTEQTEPAAYSAPDARPVETLADDNKPVVVHARSRKKQIMLGLVIALLIVAASAAVYWFMFKEKPVSQSSSDTSSNSGQDASGTVPSKTVQPDTLSYSFAASSTAAADVFWRPAIGGDRTKVLSLAGTERPNQSVVHGQQVAYVIDIYSAEPHPDAGVWYSSDGGRTFSKIYTLSKDEQITSIQFASEGTELAIALLPEVGGKNIVKSIDLSTKQAKDLFTADSMGVFIQGYSTNSKMLYFKGKYNSDGGIYNKLYSYDLQRKAESTLVDAQNGVISSVDVSPDFKQVLYAVATQDTSQPSGDMIFGYIGAPYNIFRQNLGSTPQESVKEYEVGKLGDKSQLTSVGYIPNSKYAMYYAYGNQLFTRSTDYERTTTMFYDAAKPIMNVYYIDNATTTIVASGTSDNFTVSKFDLQTKQATTLLQGDANTSIFGVTTK